MVEEVIEIHVIASESLVGVALFHDCESIFASNGVVLVLGVLLQGTVLGWIHDTLCNLCIPVCLQEAILALFIATKIVDWPTYHLDVHELLVHTTTRIFLLGVHGSQGHSRQS